jgi:hypothetical protein
LTIWKPEMRWSNMWQFDQNDSPVPSPRPLVIPYQGVSTNYSALPLMPDQDSFLDPLAPGLCYAPAGKDCCGFGIWVWCSLPLVPDQDSLLDPLAPGLCYAPAGKACCGLGVEGCERL